MDTNNSFPEFLLSKYNSFKRTVPSMIKAHAFTENMINFLFPFKVDRKCTLAQIELNLAQLQIDFKDMLGPMESTLDRSVNEISDDFFSQVPDIYRNLMDDANNYLNFDPAARSMESVVLYYPGFYAITVYRLAHVLYHLKIPFLPRMMAEYAHSKTGVDIHPGATIGRHFFIDHGTGIVIGETTTIGNNVKIYQGVTLGAICVERNLKGKKRHPTIEDNVIIYSGSSILGGETTIGKGTVIGGNAWLTKSVPPHSVVYNESKSVVKDSKLKGHEPINFVI